MKEYSLKSHKKVEEIESIIQDKANLTLESIGYLPGDDRYIPSSFYYLSKIHGGAAIGMNCPCRGSPARSIAIYGNDKETEDAQILLQKLNLINSQ